MKYMGSKARFAKYILPIVLEDAGAADYVEPFAGGMNSIDKVTGRIRYANDLNRYVISMFEAGVSGWEPPSNLSKEDYYKIRADMLQGGGVYSDYLIGFVGVGCSYCGRWFEGYAADRENRSYIGESHRNLLAQCKSLQGVKFLSCDYLSFDYPKGCVIYCDPPYANTKKYLCDFNTATFWSWVRDMSRHHKVFVSEQVAPDDFDCVWQMEAVSSLSPSGGADKAKAVEKLFRIKF